MKELFPHLKGLRGGDKQAWINANLDFIAMLNDQLGFDKTREVLFMKADTLASALKRAEARHRPVITEAQKAHMLATTADRKADAVMREQAIQAEAIAGLSQELSETKDILLQYHEMQAKIHTMTARALSGTTQARYFTEQILNPNKREVGPTTRNRRVRLTISNKVGLTSHARPSLIADRRSKRLLRQGVKEHPRHRHFRKRWFDV